MVEISSDFKADIKSSIFVVQTLKAVLPQTLGRCFFLCQENSIYLPSTWQAGLKDCAGHGNLGTVDLRENCELHHI